MRNEKSTFHIVLNKLHKIQTVWTGHGHNQPYLTRIVLFPFRRPNQKVQYLLYGRYTIYILYKSIKNISYIKNIHILDIYFDNGKYTYKIVAVTIILDEHRSNN